MSLTYRTTDLAKWGAGKGSALTAAEIDDNFWQLVERMTEVEENPPTSAEISNFQVVGTQLKIFLSDGSEFGPYTLPIATFRYMPGGFQPTFSYNQLDVFEVEGVGLILVLHAHVSDETFDLNAQNGSAEFLYHLMLPAGAGEGAVDTYPAVEHGMFGGL